MSNPSNRDVFISKSYEFPLNTGKLQSISEREPTVPCAFSSVLQSQDNLNPSTNQLSFSDAYSNGIVRIFATPPFKS